MQGGSQTRGMETERQGDRAAWRQVGSEAEGREIGRQRSRQRRMLNHFVG